MIDPSSFSMVFLVSFSLGFLTFSVFFGLRSGAEGVLPRKSLFIRDESGMWAALSQQRVLVEEAQKRLSDRNAKMAELRVAYAVVKEEVMQAWAAEAVMHTDMNKAREEAAQARRDLEPLSGRVKELEEDVSRVSRQRDALNVEVEQATARSNALKDKVTTLKGAVQEKDAALESARQEIEALKVTISDKDSALLGLERTCGGLRNEVVGLQTHIEGKCDCYDHDVEGIVSGINLFIVFQSWRGRIKRPNLLPTLSRASSKPRSRGPSCSRARSPPCVTA
jgi:chromosome segregation ATPase